MFWPVVVKVLKYALVPILMFGGGLFYKKFPKIKQDNVVEEFIEKVIEDQDFIVLDFDQPLDLSPDTPDPDEVEDGNK